MLFRSKAFFGKKGGITFSGGEPTLQAEALIPLFKELKANGIHICLDSNREMTLREYAQLVKESLKLNDVKVYGNLDSMVKCCLLYTSRCV